MVGIFVIFFNFLNPGFNTSISPRNLLKINPGESTFPHYHPNCTEVHTVIQGTVIATLDGIDTIYNREQSIYIERFQKHYFKCIRN